MEDGDNVKEIHVWLEDGTVLVWEGAEEGTMDQIYDYILTKLGGPNTTN